VGEKSLSIRGYEKASMEVFAVVLRIKTAQTMIKKNK